MKHIPIKFLKQSEAVIDADNAADAKESAKALEQRVAGLQQQLAGMSGQRRGEILLALGRTLIRLERLREAWAAGQEAFEIYKADESWQGAVEACDIMFSADQPQSLAALGHAIWLSITYPVDPELTVAMLQHVVDETPPDSDGAAVAAAAAHYVVDLRAEGAQRDELSYYTNQLIATVARRHGGVESQQDFEEWFQRLKLNDPAEFLPRLGLVVDVIVQDDWWIDRDELRARLPVH